MIPQPELRPANPLRDATAQLDATSPATAAQPISLKALAARVLARNRPCNQGATEVRMGATADATSNQRDAQPPVPADSGLTKLVRDVCLHYGCPAEEIAEALECAGRDPIQARKSFAAMAREVGIEVTN